MTGLDFVQLDPQSRLDDLYDVARCWRGRDSGRPGAATGPSSNVPRHGKEVPRCCAAPGARARSTRPARRRPRAGRFRSRGRDRPNRASGARRSRISCSPRTVVARSWSSQQPAIYRVHDRRPVPAVGLREASRASVRIVRFAELPPPFKRPAQGDRGHPEDGCSTICSCAPTKAVSGGMPSLRWRSTSATHTRDRRYPDDRAPPLRAAQVAAVRTLVRSVQIRAGDRRVLLRARAARSMPSARASL